MRTVHASGGTMTSRAFGAASRAATSATLAAALAVAAPAVVAQPSDIGVAPVVLDAESYLFDTAEQHGIRVDVVVRGLAHPYSLSFLPNGDALISERGGALRLVKGATSADAALVPEPVAGAPAPAAARGAGLHEVAVHPDFESNRLVYLTYNDAAPAAGSGPGGPVPMALKIARARFDGERLADFEDIYTAAERSG